MRGSPSLMIQNSRVYDVLKYVTQIVIPAVATLYFALSEVWGLAYGPEVVGTLVAVDTFLGVLLGISSASYHNSDERFDGTVNVVETDDKKTFTLDIQGDPYELENKSQIVLKVNASETAVARDSVVNIHNPE